MDEWVMSEVVKFEMTFLEEAMMELRDLNTEVELERIRVEMSRLKKIYHDFINPAKRVRNIHCIEFKYKIKAGPIDEIYNNNRCDLCQQNFEDGEEFTILNCRHGYHRQCCSELFQHFTICPLCRRDYGVQR